MKQLTAQEKKILMTQVAKFNTLKMAKEFKFRTVMPTFILHGDDGLFWVAAGRVSGKLHQAGYAYAED